MNKRTYNLTGGWAVILLAVAGVWLSTPRNKMDSGTVAKAALPGKNERNDTLSREGAADPVRKIHLTHVDVVGMKPAQWAERFQVMRPNVPAEITDEIVVLAGELQGELEGGLDPQGEDARAYTETMLTLLSEGALDIPQ